MKNVPNDCYELIINAIRDADIETCHKFMPSIKPQSRFAYSAYLEAIQNEFTDFCVEYVNMVCLDEELAPDNSCFLDYVCPDDDLYDFLVNHGACHSSEYIRLGGINS